MVESTRTSFESDQRGGCSVRQMATDIHAFERALADLTGDRTDDPDPLVNALLDLVGSRCHQAGQRRQIGESLFTALNKTAPCGTAINAGRETFMFHRHGDMIAVRVDGQPMAALPLDDAIRLATLLHGSTIGSERHAA